MILGKGVFKNGRMVLEGPVWADPSDPTLVKNFNLGPRQSYTGNYYVSPYNLPYNPEGRTGMIGRGLLGKWGPNHAADPIVTRWLNNDPSSRTIQFVAICRRDTGEWAFPGGMVECGDSVSATLKKEFLEETQNILEADPEKAEQVESSVEALFDNPTSIIYKGYVDDPRNTDNAWMETCCTLFHDANGDLTKDLELNAGDDAADCQWIDVNVDEPSISMYASHRSFLDKTLEYIKENCV